MCQLMQFQMDCSNGLCSTTNKENSTHLLYRVQQKTTERKYSHYVKFAFQQPVQHLFFEGGGGSNINTDFSSFILLHVMQTMLLTSAFYSRNSSAVTWYHNNAYEANICDVLIYDRTQAISFPSNTTIITHIINRDLKGNYHENMTIYKKMTYVYI